MDESESRPTSAIALCQTNSGNFVGPRPVLRVFVVRLAVLSNEGCTNVFGVGEFKDGGDLEQPMPVLARH